MVVILHIGWHRTGSTALQSFLNQHREALAERFRISYPAEGLLVCAHHPLAWAFLGRTESAWGTVRGIEAGPEASLQDAIDRARDAGCTRVVFSSEEFREFDRDAIGRLADALRGHADDVRIVAYLRRQDVLAESAYNMEVQWWGTRERLAFADFLSQHYAVPDYAPTLAAWADAFGRDALVARAYRRDAGVRWDVREDFCGILGIAPGDLAHPASGSNESLGPVTLEGLRVLNNLALGDDVHRSIVARLHEYDARHHSPRAVLFAPEERRAWLDRAGGDKRGLAAFGVDADALALDGAALPERNVEPLSPQAFAELFTYLGSPG